MPSPSSLDECAESFRLYLTESLKQSEVGLSTLDDLIAGDRSVADLVGELREVTILDIAHLRESIAKLR